VPLFVIHRELLTLLHWRYLFWKHTIVSLLEKTLTLESNCSHLLDVLAHLSDLGDKLVLSFILVEHDTEVLVIPRIDTITCTWSIDWHLIRPSSNLW